MAVRTRTVFQAIAVFLAMLGLVLTAGPGGLAVASAEASTVRPGNGASPFILAQAVEVGPRENGQVRPEDDEEPEEGIAYRTRIEGVPEPDLLEILRESAQLYTLADRPPSTLAGLRRRASDDVQRLRAALRSEGFYASDMSVEIRDDVEPVEVILRVETGTVYLLAEASVVYDPAIGEDEPVPREAHDLGVDLGERARAPRIVAAQRELLRQLRNNGYPDAAIVDRRAVVDHDDATLNVRWHVNPGARVRLGAMETEGLETVDEGYIRGFREWTVGEVFDQRKVESTRRTLMRTGLFRGVGAERQDADNEETPVRFRFEERQHRSIGFSARYSTSEGFGGQAFWEHRNLLSRNEQLRLSVDVAEIGQEVRADLRNPRFRRPDQDLIANTAVRRQETDAFDEEAISVFAGLERQLTENVRGSLGASVDLITTEDVVGRRDFVVWGLPGSLVRDTRDDVLDPASGSRLEYSATPFLSTIDETRPFMRNVLRGSAFAGLGGDNRVVLAGRAMVGSIVGTETLRIPPSKRFFGGGGGSIRGFPFQLVGPLDENDDPIGGRSVIELSGEIRTRITENIGFVPFVDVGNVFDKPYPDFSSTNNKAIRYAAGLGFRYFTPIGPLRFDVAVPLNKRDVDSDFEIYISFGQAF